MGVKRERNTIISLAVKFLLGLGLFILPLSAYNQQITLDAGIDSTHVLIGDQVKLHFEVQQPRDFKVYFPEFQDTVVKNVEILEKYKRDTSFLSENLMKVRQEYLVTSFDSGFYYFPPYEFPIENEFIQDTIASKPFYLQVFTLKADTAKGIFDIKPPYQAPVTVGEVIPWVLYTLLAAGIVLAVIFLVRKTRKKEPILLPAKPKEPAHVMAIRKLEDLKEKKLWQSGHVKAYYSELTEIVREYIEGRFQIKALEQTSDEILEALGRKKLQNQEAMEELRELLQLADLVKFAKANPLPDENDKCYRDAYDFVRRTKWEPEDSQDLQEQGQDQQEQGPGQEKKEKPEKDNNPKPLDEPKKELGNGNN
jgi:hypothetical protein